MNMGYRAVREMNIMLRKRTGNKSAINIPPIGVMERASTTPVLPATALVKRAKAFIKAHGCDRIGVADIAGHLGVSRRLAELRFRQLEGISLRQAIETHRLEKAKHLLIKSDMSITDIAKRCGFSGQNRLCHVFMAKFGKSPTHFRKGK